MGRPTLVSLAAELGVSRQTVSNVINAPHLVKTETRERVQAAIDASGYRPNMAAQALRSQRSLTIAMRLYPSYDGIYGLVMDRFLHRLVNECRAHGYYMMPLTATDDADEANQLLGLQERGSIDACLLSGTSAVDERPRRLVDAGLTTATFGRPWQDDGTHLDWVDVDGAGAIARATQLAWETGYRRLGFIGLPPGSGPGDDRRSGWRRAVQEVQPELAEDAECDDVVAQGLAAAEQLAGKGVEAFICASDSLAFGAVEHFRRQGLSAGEAPVIGFDDTPVAQALGFSSVTQPVEMAVHLLVHTLLERLRPTNPAEPLEVQEILLPGTVARRGVFAAA